jgi:hypothetical protein
MASRTFKLHRLAAADQFAATDVFNYHNIAADLAFEDLPFLGYIHHKISSDIMPRDECGTPFLS